MAQPRILDASIAIKWFVEEADSEQALEILKDCFQNPSRYFVPELFFFELSNILNRAILNDMDERLPLFHKLFDIGFNRISLNKSLSERTRNFQKIGLSGYDAAYVALAEALNGTWITADIKAHTKIKKHNLSKLLKDIESD